MPTGDPASSNPDRGAVLRDAVLAYRPVLMRGAVADWPVLESGREPVAVANYLAGLANDGPVETFTGQPEIKGRFFYEPGMRGLNFERRQETLKGFMGRLLSLMEVADPPSVYLGAAPINDRLPGFSAHNRMTLVDPAVEARLWVGNAVTVSTHYDLSDNIACVVAGKRRFTLFPPDQLGNLYVGPLDFTLAGQPVSMVDLKAPDLERFPRFAAALETAQVFDLEPGDALYIPPLWWHHVESLTPFNVLVNYWWNASGAPPSAFEALIHAVMTVRPLPGPQREAWRNIFEHYVFERDGDPVPHLPVESRGVLGPMTPSLAQRISSFLMNGLRRG